MTHPQYPPGPRSVAKAYYALYRDPLRFLAQMAGDYGDISHLQAGSRHDFLINHPEYIKAVLLAGEEEMRRSFPRPLGRLLGEGLLTLQGESHRRERRMLQPLYHAEQLAVYANTMTRYSGLLDDRWSEGETVDICAEMLRLTMRIVVQSLFSLDIEGEDAEGTAGEMGHLLGHILELSCNNRVPFLDEWAARLPLPRVRRYHRARARLDELIREMIDKRKGSAVGQTDLLSEMIGLRDGVDGPRLDGPRSMSDQQVRDEAMTAFAAGHETIGTALTWTWYLLAQHPEVERRLHEEVDTALEGRPATVEDMKRLPYTTMVLSESMRLYPPVWLVVRRPARDFPLGDFIVPAGSYIHISQYLTHRDARFFPDPERFDPDRWTPEASAARHKFCYFPFGGGSRRCIGEAFAWMEGVLVIASLAQRWRMRLSETRPLELQPLVTLHPKHGIRMTLERRKPVVLPALSGSMTIAG